ncbi:MAG: enoyl-CoA hydratase/isomerase family protein [Pseudomonas sp.]|jgi:enoyl-CoA hydratase/carnithine racemase|uniref:enoyl-CoA hydratase/isomerase family protein n=1 Tax=unclassified Pseudomonas TaxID=196821 RepID=UPI000272C990|nr:MULTISPECIES: enoyl-CoA hydratase/isomerase family protein [unclassified Pseudomonas]MDP9029652.1 enoyl-CoA hydratase/isomerase family protein [Pseudomonadota bacterium]EJF72106.1 putative hydratase [Pseudomonas sp. Ag1]MDE1910597.1 enoyl-CoA hydratase/isomerase family protein [Pseudomonas sp.]MDE2036213.1 enoyl-CoA hydratase/isomerase family protein [Pseudomonas sp.]MDE2189408.1 enoyl-CoA hydratase/isomerase family protein [Pseudomonas sp.]|eukprot:gene1539-2320_t
MTAQVSSEASSAGIVQDEVLAHVRNHIGHLTLNRPAGLNALTLDMVRSLSRHLQAWADDPQVHAVVLRGAGEKAFCAGGDIRSLYDSFKSGDTLHEDFFVEEYALDLAIHNYRKPVLALMDGFVLGGGMGLVQGADLRVVTDRSRLAMPEVAIGYFPDVGGSYFLPRISGELGIYLGVTGVQIRAADALYCGLADWYLDSTRLADLDQRLDRLEWHDSPLKDLQGLLASLAVQQLPDAPLAALRPAIDHFFALPDVPSIVEQLQQVTVADSHDWALTTASLMQTRSPLAMAVTLQMLRRGRHLPLEQCFALELHLDRQWFARGDLIEGVRALLIDKDKTPRWNPPTLQALEADHVESFFRDFDKNGN